MIKIVFHVLALILQAVAVLLIGVVSAIISFIVIVNLGFMYAPGFTYSGWQRLR